MGKTADDLYQMSRRWFSFLPLAIITSKEHHRPRHYLSQMDSSQSISAPSVRREPRHAEMAGATIFLFLPRAGAAVCFLNTRWSLSPATKRTHTRRVGASPPFAPPPPP